MTRPNFAPALLLCAPLLAAGCSGVGSISGTVSSEGKTVASGTVVIVGRDHRPYYGTIEEDGSYTVSDVPTGFARIAVFSPGPPERDAPEPPAEADSRHELPARVFPGDPRKWFPLPDKYKDFNESGLSLTVTRGMNQRDLELD